METTGAEEVAEPVSMALLAMPSVFARVVVLQIVMESSAALMAAAESAAHAAEEHRVTQAVNV